MSSELKMLLVSMALLIGGVTYMYVSQHYTCQTIEYQDLKGTHTEDICTWEK
jgi:hypothetical protein